MTVFTLQFACDECGTFTEAVTGNYEGEQKILCDECDEYYVYCRYCGFSVLDSSLCRHIAWSDNFGGYCGCGYGEHGWESHKRSFFLVLDIIGISNAEILLNALRQHRYFHQFRGSIFRYENLNAYWLNKEGKLKNYGKLFDPIFDMDRGERRSEETVEGLNWLISLWSGLPFGGEDSDEDENRAKYAKTPAKTPDADLHTAGWILQWIQLRVCETLYKARMYQWLATCLIWAKYRSIQ